MKQTVKRNKLQHSAVQPTVQTETTPLTLNVDEKAPDDVKSFINRITPIPTHIPSKAGSPYICNTKTKPLIILLKGENK